MLIKPPSDIAPSEITPRGLYLRRREFLAGAASFGLAGALSASDADAAPLPGAKSPLSTTDEQATQLRDITSYNNFYEFGTDKADAAVAGEGRRPRGQARRLSLRRPHQGGPARGAHLPHALCGGLVDGDPMGGLSAGGGAEKGGAAGQRQVRRLRDPGTPVGDAG